MNWSFSITSIYRASTMALLKNIENTDAKSVEKSECRGGNRMNEKQNNLKEELDFICRNQYDGDMKAMILDLLVVMGNWAEFEMD